MSYENRGLQRLQDNLRNLSDTKRVPLLELFSPEFMREHTPFPTFQSLLEASPFSVHSAEDLQKIPSEDWDAFTRTVTRFHSWEEMQKEAGLAWVKSQLLRGL